MQQTCPNGCTWESKVDNPTRCAKCNCRMGRKDGQDQSPSRQLGESSEISGNTWTVTLPKTRIHTLEQLLEYCKVDTQIWEVDRFVVNKWEVGAKLGNEEETELRVEPLFQVKAFLKRKVTVERARNEIQDLIREAKKFSPHYPTIKRTPERTGNLLEINLADHHFGKLAWSPETGWGDYDLKIAGQIWDEATDALIARVINAKFDKVVIVIGNDLMHMDNQAGTTTRGTQLTIDSRFQKIYPSVRKAAIRTIDKLLTIASVKAIVMPGNHDANASFCMGDSLDCWYRNCKDVEIDNSPAGRKYMQWGKVLLMWTHGNEGKLADYPQIMAVEVPHLWGATSIREVHTGDKHQRRLEEFHGVAVRILPTLCAADEWHSSKGFVGNQRCSEAYIWNKSEGLIGTAVYTHQEDCSRAANNGKS